MIWENGIETCIISYKKRIASPGWMHDTGCLGLVHGDDPEGWYGEGGGRVLGIKVEYTELLQGLTEYYLSCYIGKRVARRLREEGYRS